MHIGTPRCSGRSWGIDFQSPLENFHKSYMANPRDNNKNLMHPFKVFKDCLLLSLIRHNEILDLVLRQPICNAKVRAFDIKKKGGKLIPKFKTLLTNSKYFEKLVPSMFDWTEQKLKCKLLRPFLTLITFYYPKSPLKIGFFLVFLSGTAI